MRKTIVLALIALAVIFLFWNLPRQHQKIKEVLVENEAEDPSEEFSKALEEEADLMKDPHTGKIPSGMRDLEMNQAREIFRKQANNGYLARVSNTAYTYQGPGNLGGRTRALAFDLADASGNTLIAGSVSGGVFKTINGGNTWTRVSPNDQLYSITALAQDPRPGFRNTWYYGGGEAIGNSVNEGGGAPYTGNGLYKSTDGGNSWTRLSSSNTGSNYSFDNRVDFISRIAVNPVNGDIYLACVGQILRSKDGGGTWQPVQTSSSFSSSNQHTDVLITPSGRVYTAFSGTSNNGNAPAVDGVWTSSAGDAGTYTKIAGSGSASSPAQWNGYGAYGRVVLGVTPSNENLVYALYYRNVTSSCSTPSTEAELYRWDQSSATWTDLTPGLPDEPGCLAGNDPFAVQAGYDMCVAVKPNDPNTILLGGTNLYRSADGGMSWTRIGGYSNTAGFTQWTNHHSDIHMLQFSPADPAILACADDGGIQKTDITTATTLWTSLNNNYPTFQYYHVALKQETGSDDVIGGAQDNGTTTSVSGSNNFTSIISGDGVAVGLGAGAAPYKQYAGSQNGTVYRRNSGQAPNFMEANLTPPGVTSIFVTYFLLDPDNTENLYYAGQVGGFNKLLRLNNASTATSAGWKTFDFNFDGYIRSMATTRGNYSSTSRLFMGTDGGRVYRLPDPANALAGDIPVDITPPGMIGSGTVIGIAVNPTNHDEVMAVYSNYNTISIWHTTDAGNDSPTWTNVEGNLTLPSVRCAMILKSGSSVEYYVGTTVGLFKTTALNGSATVWNQEAAAEIGNAVVTSLSLRPSDNNFVIGTHGSGMWKGVATMPLPVLLTDFTGTLVNNSARLQWGTAEENNNKGFYIERSYDGIQFTKIGFVQGWGNSSVRHNYTFTDPEIAQEENFYRLRQTDLDGKETISGVVMIRNGQAPTSKIKLLNNPFDSRLDIQLPGRLSSQLYVRLIGMNGSIVYQQNLKETQNRVRLDLSSLHLSGGAYLLQVTDGPQQYTVKVIKN